MHLHYGDLTDATNLIRIVQQVQPDEIYNLAAQSHVAVSFETPEYTANSDALGTLRILEAIRILGLDDRRRASTRLQPPRCSARCRRLRSARPRRSIRAPLWRRQGLCPLDHRQLSRGLWHVCLQWHSVQSRVADPRRNIRHAQDHPRAWREFAQVWRGCLYLGNLDSLRDWGHARDYVRAQWLMLQQPKPEDFVIATGEQHSVREFVTRSAACLGMNIEWRGSGHQEQGVDTRSGRAIVKIDPRYFRPTEVDALLGDAAMARAKLGWSPQVGFAALVKEMVDADLAIARRDVAMLREGFEVRRHRE